MDKFLYYVKKYAHIVGPFIVFLPLFLIGYSLEHNPTKIAAQVFAGLTAAGIVYHVVRVVIAVIRTNKEIDEAEK